MNIRQSWAAFGANFWADSIAPLSRSQNRRFALAVWFSLSLAFAAYYGGLALQKAFRTGLIVQDDAREYVFWMQRLIDPDLFPNDLIADYFQSIAPAGYTALYQLMAALGIAPLTFSKLLPALLGIVSSVYCFSVCLQLLRVPIAGFIATLLLNQSLWFKDDLASAAPRAFIACLFLAFLHYLLKGAWRAVWAVSILQGLLYPPLVIISGSLLALRSWRWKKWRPHPTPESGRAALAIGLGLLMLVPYSIASAPFGPVVTASAAWQMPEFWPGGRHPYFNSNPWWFWLVGQHSGIVPPLLPPFLWGSLLLLMLLRYPDRFPLVKQIQPAAKILLQILAVSYGLFFAAHLLLLKLFFPTRYTQHTLRVVMALAAAMVLTALLDAGLRSLAPLRGMTLKQWGTAAAIVVLSLILLTFPLLIEHFPRTNYRIVKENALYSFLQQQPKQSMIASLADQADYIPTFAQRSVLVSKEYALPFHLGYYRQIRQRSLDLLQAQYSPDAQVLHRVIQQYGITHWIVTHDAFTPAFLTDDNQSWLKSFQPAYTEALAALEQNSKPALARLSRRCSVFKDDSVVVLAAACLIQPPQP